MLYFVRQCTVM